MANVDLRELQLYMLDICKEIDRICKKHDIHYYFGYGSCLGAVRHKGFIPWDDDVDLLMKPDDYLKFIDVCKTEMKDGKYYLQNHMDDAKAYNFWLQFGVKNSTSINMSMSRVHKPWGICVDIFPLFPYTKNAALQQKMYKKYNLLKLLSLKYYHVGTMQNAAGKEKIKKMVHLLVPDWVSCKIFKKLFLELCYPKEFEEECMTSYDFRKPEQYLESEWFEKPLYLEFEDTKVPCPQNYDAYLRAYYRDYMQIPKDKTKHSDSPDVVIKFDECYENYWS